MKLYSYKKNDFEVDDGVFYPTKTTELILKSIENIPFENKNILDLGCGCGIVGSMISKYNKVKTMNASDINQKTISNAKRNYQLHGLHADLRVGDLYTPWIGKKFDNIICDVSGVSDKIAEISGWFGEYAPCNSGIDGTDLGIEIIKKSPKYLNNGGKLYMAILTLSNHLKLINKLKECFINVNIIREEEYFIPKEMMDYVDLLNELQDNKCISVERRFGMIIWKTIIIEAFNN